MSEMFIVKDNGSLVGSDGDYLYDGVRHQIGFDELTVETTVAQDGLSFERNTMLPDGTVRTASIVTKDGFEAASRSRIIAGLPEGYSEGDYAAALEAAWEVEKQITSHGKVFIDAYVDGVLTSIEKKITCIEWTVR